MEKRVRYIAVLYGTFAFPYHIPMVASAKQRVNILRNIIYKYTMRGEVVQTIIPTDTFTILFFIVSAVFRCY